MAGLQRSAQTFRRSGSSGLVWDERFLTEGGAGRPELRHSRSVGGTSSVPQVQRRVGEAGGHDDDTVKRKPELARPPKQKSQRQKQRRQQEVVAPAVGKAFRARDAAPAAEPPSPRVPGCCTPCAILRGSAATGGSPSSLAWRASAKR